MSERGWTATTWEFGDEYLGGTVDRRAGGYHYEAWWWRKNGRTRFVAGWRDSRMAAFGAVVDWLKAEPSQKRGRR